MELFDLRLWPKFSSAGGDSSTPAIIDQVIIDSRRIDSKKALFVALQGKQHDGHQFVSQAARAGARFALVRKDWQAPNLPRHLTLLRVEDPLRSLQELAFHYRKQLPTTILAVTGSYGKTMVKDLLCHILSPRKKVVASPESFNSQIGVPLSLFMIQKADEIALIEAGISLKGEMDLLAKMIAPNCAIITNIGNAHIGSLKTLEATAEEKIQLPLKSPEIQWCLLPSSPLLSPYLPQASFSYYFWDQATSALPHTHPANQEFTENTSYTISFPDGKNFSGEIASSSYYLLDLINMAIKTAWLFKIPSSVIYQALQDYVPEPMRREVWKSPMGAIFINDSYCSDPQSVDIALKQLNIVAQHQRKIFVFGGMRTRETRTDADYRRIGKAISSSSIDLLTLFGHHNFSPLVKQVQQLSPQTEISFCSSFEEAISQIRSQVKKEDAVLIKGTKKEPFENLTKAFNESINNNQLIIDLAAVASNIEILRDRLPPKTRVMAMVKAQAYGTDDIRIAKFLASTCDIDIFGVSYVEEGIALRRAGVSEAVFVINATLYEAAKVVKWDLEVGVSDLKMVETLEQEAAHQKKKVKVHLHVDTGMSRFGCRLEEALEIAKAIKQRPHLHLEGIMTHFACADNPQEDSFTYAQAKCFEETIHLLKTEKIDIPWAHAANSSGAIRFHFPSFNMVRIGLGMYGLHASEDTRKAISLKSALCLISHIVGINKCRPGESIGYGRTYTVKMKEQRIGILPIGYFDGLHRNYSGKGNVIIRGQPAPKVGNICMDFMMIDVTNIPNVKVGDSVLIFGVNEQGHTLPPEIFAQEGGSITHELITCLGPRIQRIFINEP